MDKKSLVGLGLIAGILGVWLYFSGPSPEQIKRNKAVRDSIERVQQAARVQEAARIASEQTKTDTLKQVLVLSDSARNTQLVQQYKDFAVSVQGNKTYFSLENSKLKARISSKGAQIVQLELKDYQRYGQQSNLILFEEDSTRFALSLNAYDRSRIFHTDSFYFKPVKQEKNELVLRLETARPGSYIDFVYRLKPDSYMLESEILFVGMQSIISQTEDQLQLNWNMLYPGQEKNINKEREAATIYYKQEINSPDYINPSKDEEKELSDADIKWVSFKQQFFNSTIIAKQVFAKSGSLVKLGQRPEHDVFVKSARAELGIPYLHQSSEKFAFDFYFGPNHYNTLKSYGQGLEEIVPTGWSIFSYINKWLVIPLFNWKILSGLGMGLVILILTLVVKVLLLPIAYKTYMSGAKMRVLKPETDALNAKFEKNADPMKKQQELMGLYRKAGVNPLSGCIPLLLQFPILIALFAFIPASIELRQQSFLWADDLSTYDSIWTFGHVPFIASVYGDHVSLFAALMFVSTIVYTYMNSNLMPQQGNAQMPGMKFMMYFMPVIFLAVMNRYAAGLSWYYFLANMFTFLQNFIIKKIVSDQKIRAQLEANMKKPVKVSNFQKRLQDMAKQREQSLKKR
ncbi:MAG TPA: membrane protein insertase YidC [Bacteroidia bacterium]|nr:membrane protein insertase YidC [Bacteroidia bacterium]